jgi:hypothetical protein
MYLALTLWNVPTTTSRLKMPETALTLFRLGPTSRPKSSVNFILIVDALHPIGPQFGSPSASRRSFSICAQTARPEVCPARRKRRNGNDFVEGGVRALTDLPATNLIGVYKRRLLASKRSIRDGSGSGDLVLLATVNREAGRKSPNVWIVAGNHRFAIPVHLHHDGHPRSPTGGCLSSVDQGYGA